jgi:toxin-antitoxin system PIN domain toxin
MFVADTNVLLYAADSDFEEHEACRDVVERSRRDPYPWFLTWPIVFEFLRVSTHPRVFRKPRTIRQAWTFVSGLLASPGLQMLVATERHAEIAAHTFAEVKALRGNLLHDARTAILMREHGIRRIVTRDADFHRFPFLEVVGSS